MGSEMCIRDRSEYVFLVKRFVEEYGAIAEYTGEKLAEQLGDLIRPFATEVGGRHTQITIERIFKYAKDPRAPAKIMTFKDKHIGTVLKSFKEYASDMPEPRRELLLSRLTSAGVVSKAIRAGHKAASSILEGGFKLLSSAVQEGTTLHKFFKAALQAQVDPFSITPEELDELGYHMAEVFYEEVGGMNIIIHSPGASKYVVQEYLKVMVDKVVEIHRKRLMLLMRAGE